MRSRRRRRRRRRARRWRRGRGRRQDVLVAVGSVTRADQGAQRLRGVARIRAGARLMEVLDGRLVGQPAVEDDGVVRARRAAQLEHHVALEQVALVDLVGDIDQPRHGDGRRQLPARRNIAAAVAVVGNAAAAAAVAVGALGEARRSLGAAAVRCLVGGPSKHALHHIVARHVAAHRCGDVAVGGDAAQRLALNAGLGNRIFSCSFCFSFFSFSFSFSFFSSCDLLGTQAIAQPLFQLGGKGITTICTPSVQVVLDRLEHMVSASSRWPCRSRSSSSSSSSSSSGGEVSRQDQAQHKYCNTVVHGDVWTKN